MKCTISCIVLSLVALVAWVNHVWVIEYADHLTLPPAFWSTALFSLFIAFLLQGLFCLRRS